MVELVYIAVQTDGTYLLTKISSANIFMWLALVIISTYYCGM